MKKQLFCTCLVIAICSLNVRSQILVDIVNHTPYEFIATFNTTTHSSCNSSAIGHYDEFYYDIGEGAPSWNYTYEDLLDEDGISVTNYLDLVGITLKEIGIPCNDVTVFMCPTTATPPWPGSSAIFTSCLGATITVSWQYIAGPPATVRIVIQ